MGGMPETMRELADNLGKYIMDKFVSPRLRRSVSYFTGTVTAAASGGKIKVQRPFDETVYALPYVGSAAGLAVGDSCVVLVLGSMSNAYVLGNGTLSNL